MRRRLSLSAGAAVLLLMVLLATASNGGNLHTAEFDPPRSVGAHEVLAIGGTNPTSDDRTLVIRLDDGLSQNYASRVNLERVLPPGDFALRIPLSGLHTPSNRPLDTTDLRRLLIFEGNGGDGLELETVSIETVTTLSPGSFGWDLGTETSSLEEGFQRISDTFDGIDGEYLSPLDRGTRAASSDPLISDGISGVRQLRLPLPNGHWHVALWTRDLGEWEYLPHPLSRTIKANGAEVYRTKYTPSSWIAKVYLEGKQIETPPGSDPWTAFGGRRGGRVEFETKVTDGELRLELTGKGPAAHYLAAVFAEPAGGQNGLNTLEERRAHRFRSNWRTGTPATPEWDMVIDLSDRKAPLSAPHFTAAPNTSIGLNIALSGQAPKSLPNASVTPPRGAGFSLTTEARTGHWRYKRPNAAGTQLISTDSHLRSDPGATTIGTAHSRRLNLRIFVPPDAPPGRYLGEVRLNQRGDDLEPRRFVIDVLPVVLPEVQRPIGVYLDEAPHLTWFPELEEDRIRQRRCDLAYLSRLGLTGLSPALPTPLPGREDDFIAAIREIEDFPFQAPVLAYTPTKRLLASEGLQGTVNQMAAVDTMLRDKGYEPPTWAIADEPSHLGGDVKEILELSAKLRSENEHISLAGQLNNPADTPLLGAFDVALVNHAFGADLETLDALKASGLSPWFYNMPQPRLSAGFYLWRVAAGGYLQWHARMPTADPFDPTDGREGDIQLLYPSASVCPKVPDVDLDLFRLVDGIVDLRWLLWLEEISLQDAAAASLLTRLRREIPTRWREAAQIADRQLADWRRRITDFARQRGTRAKPQQQETQFALQQLQNAKQPAPRHQEDPLSHHP